MTSVNHHRKSGGFYTRESAAETLSRVAAAMRRFGKLPALLALALAAGLITGEMKTPSLTAKCAECGDGPKDRKCGQGERCVDGTCKKR